MQLDARVLCQPHLDGWRLVRREVVDDDVDHFPSIPAGRLIEERHKLRRAVARDAVPPDVPRRHFRRGIERQRPAAQILEAVALRPGGAQRAPAVISCDAASLLVKRPVHSIATSTP